MGDMYYYHMTALRHLRSIAAQGLVPKNGDNGKLIGEEKVKVYFSEGFEGAVALFVDFSLVFEKIRKNQLEITDQSVKERVLSADSLSDYLGEGVYLWFDGTGIRNERNFENGCTGMTIPPEKLSVCILRREKTDPIIFSRFEIVKYMMMKTKPEQIKYDGADYEGSPDFAAATARIQEKVRTYYQGHQRGISAYAGSGYVLESVALKDFIREYGL